MGLIAIGDVHGCAQTLDRMLERLSPTAEDHLVFVGDYVDRGPDSRGVIERLLNLSGRQRCTFLRGNHEALMLTYLDGLDGDLWFANGGIATLRSYQSGGQPLEIPESHVDFVRRTQLYLDTPEFFFVHAGLRAEMSIADNLARYGENVLLWERGHLAADEVAWEKPVVFGHTPQQQPINRERMIGIDTGCVFFTHPMYGRLTAVRLPERAFVTVEYEG